MFRLDNLLGLVAPHFCLSCGDEGAVVCDWCLPDFVPPLPARCYKCQKSVQDSAVCNKCSRAVQLKHVWVRAEYEKSAKALVRALKFEHKRAAALPIARMIAETLPYLPPGTLITHVPTASSRVRQRGYDQAELIARCLAKEINLEYQPLLMRLTQTRQVGAKREARKKQIEGAYRAINTTKAEGRAVLMIDDLTTTGATLEAAAKCLKQAGAKTINAAVFAQKQ